MCDVYESIIEGLNEVINDVKSKEKKLKRNVVDNEVVKENSVEEIKKDN